MPEQIYRSELELGKRYRDKATKFEGTCTCIYFYEHGCERCTLKGKNSLGEIKEYAFDAPELELITDDAEPVPVQLVEKKTGGPHGTEPMRRR